MKKRWLNLDISAVLAAVLTLPAAQAWGRFEQPTSTVCALSSELPSADTFVYDTAGLLDADQIWELSNLGAAAAEQYGCGLYIVTLGDYRSYSEDVDTCGKELYTQLGYGVGEDASGCLLLLSMAERDYRLICHGYGNVAFTDYGKTYLAEAFLDDFGADDWYSGFADYMDTAGEMLELARAGEPVDVGYDDGSSQGFGVVLCVLLGLVIAFIVRGVLRGQMKSVAAAGEAKYYVNRAGTDMDVVQDLYTHTTQSRVYDPPRKDNDSGGGGGTTIGSDGFSSSGGKF